MDPEDIDTRTLSSSSRLRSTAILCAVFLLSIAPYTISFGLSVPIGSRTPVFVYFLGLLVLPFLAVVGVVSSVRLVEAKSWRTFGVILGIVAFAVCTFVLYLWIRFDHLTLVKPQITLQRSWMAISGGIVIALIVFTIAVRFLQRVRWRSLARFLLFFSSLCAGLGAFHAFQFLPTLYSGGRYLGSLRHYLTEDLVGVAAPPFSLRTLNGDTHRLESDSGKIVVIDFWATWCGPCVKALPHLEALHREFGDPRVTFLALSTDRDTSAVAPFIDSFGYSFTTLYATSEVAKAYRLEVIPTTFIVDKGGIIRKVLIGFDPDRSPEAVRSFLQELLDE